MLYWLELQEASNYWKKINTIGPYHGYIENTLTWDGQNQNIHSNQTKELSVIPFCKEIEHEQLE